MRMPPSQGHVHKKNQIYARLGFYSTYNILKVLVHFIFFKKKLPKIKVSFFLRTGIYSHLKVLVFFSM